MLNLFAQALKISHRTSSAYHPENQGVLELFHQTLKAMLRKYCFETGKDWDEGTSLFLFAMRIAVQESLGLSPAHYSVRGPLMMLKEDMLSQKTSDKMNVLDYLSKFRERLHNACSIAKEALLNAQITMKSSLMTSCSTVSWHSACVTRGHHYRDSLPSIVFLQLKCNAALQSADTVFPCLRMNDNITQVCSGVGLVRPEDNIHELLKGGGSSVQAKGKGSVLPVAIRCRKGVLSFGFFRKRYLPVTFG